MSGININPMATTNAAGSFNISSVGLIQGTAYDDPAARFQLAGGILNASEILPMWGGVGIFENVPGPSNGTNPDQTLGSQVGRATALTGSKLLAGFSVFNQAHAMLNTPQSPVPTALVNMSVNFYRFGSLARVAVACDPILASLEGGATAAQVSWDFVNQLLVPYEGTLTISSGTYNNTTGVVTLVMSAPVTFGPGDSIIVSGLSGTGAFAGLAGTFTALTASGTSVTYNAGAGVGASTITGGSLTLGSGSDVALPVKVLQLEIGNSMTVSYNASTQVATWNRNGSCAVILL